MPKRPSTVSVLTETEHRKTNNYFKSPLLVICQEVKRVRTRKNGSTPLTPTIRCTISHAAPGQEHLALPKLDRPKLSLYDTTTIAHGAHERMDIARWVRDRCRGDVLRREVSAEIYYDGRIIILAPPSVQYVSLREAAEPWYASSQRLLAAVW